jgi:tetratricopeptide (TPR) repeat protein
MAQPSARPDAVSEISRAIALHQQGRFDEAAQLYDVILAAAPDRPDALNLLGLARYQQGRNADALRLIGAALARADKSADIINNFALVLAALGRQEEALAHFEKALAIAADHVNALANRADTLKRLKRDEEALAAYAQLLTVQPDHLGAMNESGGLNTRLGRPEAALAHYDRALAIASAAELYVNKGTALRALNRDDEALASFAAAAAVRPDCAEAHWNAALVRLRHGDFATGWRDYEWRWRKADWAGRQRDFASPPWRGRGPIAGKTVLLHAEQGFGDTIQFARYARLVAERGATVVLECQPQLKNLLQNIDGAAHVIAAGEPLPSFDVHCPLLSLPLALGTELATVPCGVPYIRPPAERTEKWRDRLPSRGRQRVGLCWAGSGAHLSDRHRSISFDQFCPILSVDGIDFVSLQKELRPLDAALLRKHDVAQPSADFADFADTAAVIAMLDLIISVDTSVAHLAGAMGKPVALLLPFSPDFRWMLDRDDSPWYPTMRLFRQTSLGAWDGVITRVRDALVEIVRRPGIAPEIALRIAPEIGWRVAPQ